MNRSNGLALFWALIVCGLLAHTGYLWLKQRIIPDTDILALLPADRRNPVLQQAFVHMIESAQQRLVILIGAKQWRDALRAAGAYREVIEQHSDVVELKDRHGEAVTNWLKSFQRHRLGLMQPRDERALRIQPAQFWVNAALARLYSPFGAPTYGAWQDDPFGLFSSWAQARAQETPVRLRDGRLFVADAEHEYVVMPMTLRVPAFSSAGQDALIPLLGQATQAARRTVPQVEILQTGIVLHAAAAGAQARRELSIIGMGSAAGIVLLMWLTFHSLKPVALIFLPVVIGCLGALSVCWFWFDKIHLITLVFGASLIGVAQDYGIYFLCQRAATDAALDSARLMRRILAPLFLSLVTTVIGYMGLLFTPFPGLSQMAIFSVSGLLFAWLTVVFCFPTLVRGRLAIKLFYLAESMHWPVVRRDRGTIVVGALFFVLAIFGWMRVNVQDDVRLLQNAPQHLIDDQLKANKLLDLPAPGQFYVVRGRTPEAVLQQEEALKRKLDPLIEQKLITGYHAISNWVPSAELQTSRRRLIEQSLLKKDGALAAVAAKLGEDQDWVEATRARLLASAQPLSTDEFFESPAGEPWRYLWIGRVGDTYASIVALRGVGRASLAGLRQAGSGLEGVQWVDRLADISSVLGNYRRYMSWVLMLSYATVYGLLYPRYRDASWRVLAPTALASVGAVAFLGLAGQSLQLFHILALMLLLGIGVDYGIFFQEQGRHRDTIAGLAVGLSAASTLLSFGLLAVSATPVLQAFGMTMAVGIAAVWLLVPCFRIEPAAIDAPASKVLV